MIERLYIKDCLTFNEVDLKFSSGLNVFTGVSGAGKSVLFNAFLGAFGLKDSEAKLAEANVDYKFDMMEFGLENDEINSFKMLKDKSVRFFINSQLVSKKNVASIAKEHIKYLNAKENGEFENDKLLEVLDAICMKKDLKYKEILVNFKVNYEEYSKILKELNKIELEESKIEELKEFAKFEISKIDEISPKIGEYDELMEIKKKLSKKDKIIEFWNKAENIFNYESAVVEALRLSDKDSAFFEDSMNELRNIKESLNLNELDDIDIEHILDRIELLSSLNRRYGSIEEALNVLEKRKQELAHYEDISFEKENLQKKLKSAKNVVDELALEISKARKSSLDEFVSVLNDFLSKLYMNEVSVSIEQKELDDSGLDEVLIEHSGVDIKKLSSGETNRLRLAFIALRCVVTKKGNGVILLDEIDANLSGKEAMSIANVLNELSCFYQIFAISHQPQLSSRADTHFVVEKNDEISSVYEIKDDEKAKELARMISGENISKEAMDFAAKMLNEK
ncbi:AAA family ATPase [Campylobacter sputorum]|uniref:AAA family ATPase n=1 Tax=Campylobacter sputorum TaxID=206 RepID=UPI001E356595|nr:AAA family ATPase [Campylobacter sputorum]